MSPPVRLPDINSLRNEPEARQIQILDLLFEPSTEIHSLLLPYVNTGSFQSFDEFITGCQTLFESVIEESSDPGARAKLHSILGSHPRLGAEKVESAQSASEQAKLQAGDPTQLAALNAEYEAKFPGLRYVVFVNGRGRPEIMHDMRRRISRGDMALEEREGIQVGHVSKHFRSLIMNLAHHLTGHVRYCKRSGSKASSLSQENTVCF
jgi:2-oxo-4-hydroxy-4-carboxy--5-ureidoimidazoline (OHCU) decarboxylase